MMTEYQLARRAVKLWNNELAPKSLNRANARKWIKSVLDLGDRWVFAHDWKETLRKENELINRRSERNPRTNQTL